jgi:uncharacterized protein YjiS (DUF1127 family)
MSCGSTICTSATYGVPAWRLLARFDSARGRVTWLDKVGHATERRHQRRQLLDLDDRLLADIGISRQQAVEEARKFDWTCLIVWRIGR